MRKNLFVGNLPFTISSDDLRGAFEKFGEVASAHVIADRATGQSKGFGFVEMKDGADEAIAGLHGTEWQGRTLIVNEARAREERTGAGRPQRGYTSYRF